MFDRKFITKIVIKNLKCCNKNNILLKKYKKIIKQIMESKYFGKLKVNNITKYYVKLKIKFK